VTCGRLYLADRQTEGGKAHPTPCEVFLHVLFPGPLISAMKLTHETESLKSSQSHSWSETSPPFMEPQFYYSVQKRPPLDRNAILLNSDHTLTFHFLKFLFYVVSYPHLLLGIPGDFVLQIFLLTFCINFPPIPCVLCVPPISYSLICCCRSPIFEAIYIFCPFPKNSFKSETLYSLRFLW